MNTTTPTHRPKPLVLLILDGWGYRTNTTHNAIHQAHTPTWDHLWENYPHTLLTADGNAVGLPNGQMGNSEVGHLHMGAGRPIMQDLKRINKIIENKEFFKNKVLLKALQTVRQNNAALHLIGLLSAGGVHSHINHIQAAVELAAAQGIEHCFIHAILDGRDTPPRDAMQRLENFEKAIAQLPCGQIVSLIGRYFAMDRDKRWPRTQAAYTLLTQADAQYTASSATEGLAMAYARGETDEFVQATRIATTPTKNENSGFIRVRDNDAVCFMNFRADRMRQLTQAFSSDSFDGFKRATRPALGACITLTQQADNITADVAFPSPPVTSSFGEYIAHQNLHQLRIAETEKYAHVTFFFNGGIEQPFANEERILVPSPPVATYDLQPEMSAPALTQKLIEAIAAQQHDVIICNYANADMVGHSGNFQATVNAVEAIDRCLTELLQAIQAHNGALLVTADHGNAELMYNEKTQQPHTAHTDEPVPCVYVSNTAHAIVPTQACGKLYDVAPTLLHLLGLKQPPEMTGTTLFTDRSDEQTKK